MLIPHRSVAVQPTVVERLVRQDIAFGVRVESVAATMSTKMHLYAVSGMAKKPRIEPTTRQIAQTREKLIIGGS